MDLKTKKSNCVDQNYEHVLEERVQKLTRSPADGDSASVRASTVNHSDSTVETVNLAPAHPMRKSDSGRSQKVEDKRRVYSGNQRGGREKGFGGKERRGREKGFGGKERRGQEKGLSIGEKLAQRPLLDSSQGGGSTTREEMASTVEDAMAITRRELCRSSEPDPAEESSWELKCWK